MEMTKKPIAAKPEIAPSPFSSSAEREELERAQLLPSTTMSTTTNSTQSSSSSQNYVVPTAVPIIAGRDTFDENSVPIVAVAASLPPPPPSDYRRANANANANAAAHKNYSTTNSDKSKSFIDDDDDIIVRPEPTSNSSTSSPLLLPTAPTLPTHTSNLPTTHQLTTSAQIRAANVQATLSSTEEIAHVARAQRTSKYAIQHHAGQRQKVRIANEIANRKVGKSDEGLTVDEGIHNVNNLNADSLQQQKQGDDDDDVRPYGVKQPSGKRGYDVKEYDVTEYETGEYDVKEYKSVYD